jgi:hypothetical protein
MARARATMNSRLSVGDWIQTKGSFYWHFTDIAGYRAAMV